MRILHLDSGRKMRGGQWQVLRLIEGLAAAGVESTLLAREGSPLFAAARDQGWRVAPRRLIGAASAARRNDLVHAHDARSHTIGALIPGIPLIVSRRVAFRGVGLFPALSRWKYGRPARYIAVSDFVKSVLVERGVPAGKIAVVYDGVPLMEMVGHTGGLARVLTASNAGDPAKGDSLAQEAARLAGVSLQFTSNLERDLRNATVFLYLTHSEGLGSGALLAMSAGVPVIASKVGGLPEVIRDGETGLLVPNEPAAIAAAIRRLLDDQPLVRRMGLAARQTIVDRFTVDHMVRNTMEVYRAGLEAYPT